METHWIIAIVIILFVAAGIYIGYLRHFNKGLIRVVKEKEDFISKQNDQHNKIVEAFQLVFTRFNIESIPYSFTKIYHMEVINDTFFWFQFYNPLRSNYSNVKLLFMVENSAVKLQNINCTLDKNDLPIIKHIWEQIKTFKILVPVSKGHYKQVTEASLLDDFLTGSKVLHVFDVANVDEKLFGPAKEIK